MSKWYGSINNRIEEQSRYQEPKVGDFLTEYQWSDRAPYHVSAIKTPKLIEVIEDEPVWDRNNIGYAKEIKLGTGTPVLLRWSDSRNGWCRKGDPKGSIYRLGVHDAYNDPSF